jgi:hypothetical protein
MRTLLLRLVGSTPILLHQISKHQRREEIASSARRGSMTDEAMEVMSKEGDGNPTVPVSWLWDALRVGCSRITSNGKQLSFVALRSLINLPTDQIRIKRSDGGDPVWTLYKSVQHMAPKSKKMVLVIAPMFKDWVIEFPVVVYGEFPDDSLLLGIFYEAGKTGIGLFHPPKKHFGQFKTLILQ